MDKEILLKNIDKIHTTDLGISRIKKNLKLGDIDVAYHCKNILLSPKCNIYKKGKNFYCEFNSLKITINSGSYTIITAHIL